MFFWYLDDLPRATKERLAITQLTDECDWLKNVQWTIEEGGLLKIYFTIEAHSHDYELQLTFPTDYPMTPPFVRPVDTKERLSSHQYRDGTLCLELGPDNWDYRYTSRSLIESAYRLLDQENPRENGRTVVASRHQLTFGQELRSKGLSGTIRFLLTKNLLEKLKSIPEGTRGFFKYFVLSEQDKVLTFFIDIVEVPNTTEWRDEDIPEFLRRHDSISAGYGLYFIIRANHNVPTGTLDKFALVEFLKQEGVTDARLSDSHSDFDGPPKGVLFVHKDNTDFFLINLSSGSENVLRVEPVHSDCSKKSERMSPEYSNLVSKKVAIVGTGSVGSKLAESLARMGVGQFFIVDHEVFLPENMCRHILDWREVCLHKVEAVANRVRRISSNAKVTTSVFHIAGQESPRAQSGILERIMDCDVLVDMTAEQRVFNTLAGITVKHSKPIVWARVFGGGYGGVVARSRPGLDPDPYRMRASYYRYMEKHNTEDFGEIIGDYAVEDQEGVVQVATDAEVGIIALHAARMVEDILLERTPSIFPFSMYLIGLSKGPVFRSPYDTIGIELEIPAEENIVTAEDDSEELANTTNLLKEAIENYKKNENSAAKENSS